MDIPRLIGQLMSVRVVEYLEEDPVGLFPIPRLYPPAGPQQVRALEVRAGQQLEAGYRTFLSFSDGLDGFHLTMPLFGCKDWREEDGMGVASLRFLDGLRDTGIPADVGLPEDVVLFPVSVNRDVSQGVFMLDLPEALPERWWWVGEGSSSFFENFADLLKYAIDPLPLSPREYVA
ncbi:SMI1/KNR4 family protein [Streptomyces sp. NPDC004042]|uniref:SMI1/KNR4 family protein n=1 Tax=Streptomyces sp. NPDC004042 TaxID=3154451 RepID=UPI0033B23710